MVQGIHNWLVEHPIAQNVIVNVCVGIVLLLGAAYWKLIVEFSKIQPQRLGTWVRKARLSTNKNKLAMLRRSDRDSRFALRILLGRLIFPFLWLGMMLFALSIALFRILQPTRVVLSYHRDPLLQILENRIGQFIWLLIPLLLLLRSCLQILSSASEYANMEDAQSRLIVKIATLKEELDLPRISEASREDSNVHLPEPEEFDHKTYLPGVRVRHPKYGEGVVLDTQGLEDYRNVTVQFERHGIKKLVEKYAQLKII